MRCLDDLRRSTSEFFKSPGGMKNLGDLKSALEKANTFCGDNSPVSTVPKMVTSEELGKANAERCRLAGRVSTLTARVDSLKKEKEKMSELIGKLQLQVKEHQTIARTRDQRPW
eukprot:Trichotokara_eunicae@DN11022_c0_g1_i1.p1